MTDSTPTPPHHKLKPVLLVMVTGPNPSWANTLAQELVENQLAACVNILPAITSVYRWQNALHTDAEVLLLIKTTQPQLAALTHWVETHHPYECPEVVALPVTGGSLAYLQWVNEQTG